MNALPFISLETVERSAFNAWVAMVTDGLPVNVTSDESFRPSFSLVCTVMRRFAIAESQVGDEMHAYGAPSECAALAYRGIDKRRREALRAMGWDEESFNAELVRRTSYRWAYFSGI